MTWNISHIAGKGYYWPIKMGVDRCMKSESAERKYNISLSRCLTALNCSAESFLQFSLYFFLTFCSPALYSAHHLLFWTHHKKERKKEQERNNRNSTLQICTWNHSHKKSLRPHPFTLMHQLVLSKFSVMNVYQARLYIYNICSDLIYWKKWAE